MGGKVNVRSFAAVWKKGDKAPSLRKLAERSED